LPYYSDAFLKIAKEYPDEYIEKIKRYSEKISESLGEFTKKQDITKIYSRLSSNDYRYILFVTKGFSNKQVADICGVSERTVANVYNNIYNKLGINSKKELIDEINHSLSNKR